MDPEQFFDALANVPNLRSADLADLEMKDGGNVFLFDGLAALYDTPTDFQGQVPFTEEVRHGAFDDVLASGAVVPMFHEHNKHELLATTRSGHLKLSSEPRGLRAKAKIVKTDLSRRVKALVDSGDVTGMSVGWVVGGRENQKIELRGGMPHRTILKVKRLLDVSTTWNPAYLGTEAQFRSMAMQYADEPEAWQRLLMGAYPQLAELGHDPDRRDDDPDEIRSLETAVIEEAPPGVSDADRLETAKRRMSFLLLESGGLDDAS